MTMPEPGWKVMTHDNSRTRLESHEILELGWKVMTMLELGWKVMTMVEKGLKS